MSKPLELTVYPLWFNGLDGTCYADKDDKFHPANVDFEVYRKRLDSPELLAQYWFNQAMGGNQLFGAALWRAATLPSFDEETS